MQMSKWWHCRFIECSSMPWWRHQIETFSALLGICAGNSPVNSPHKGQWRDVGCFLWSTTEWTILSLVIWDATALIMTSPQCLQRIPVESGDRGQPAAGHVAKDISTGEDVRHLHHLLLALQRQAKLPWQIVTLIFLTRNFSLVIMNHAKMMVFLPSKS